MTWEELQQELARINALLESRSRSTVSSMLASRISSLDDPVNRSRRTAAPSPSPDRGRRETSQRQATALDLLTFAHHSGPKLATKLAIAQARAQHRRDSRGR